MAMATTSSRLTTTFSSTPCSPTTMAVLRRQQRPGARYPRIQAIDLDQNTIVAIVVGVVSVGAGIGIPIFYENQIDNSAKRDNKQPCFPCSGSGAQVCRFCTGAGTVTVEIGSGESEVSKCVNCDGIGSLTCTTCQGSGIQPRYLDRRPQYLSATEIYEVVHYLVKCGGKLLMVQRFMLSTIGFWDSRTVGFKVIEVDMRTNAGQWRMVSDLGGHTLFLGKQSSKSVPSRECSGSQDDCIYFMCDHPCPESSANPLRDAGIYNIRNGDDHAVAFRESCNTTTPSWPVGSDMVFPS